MKIRSNQGVKMSAKKIEESKVEIKKVESGTVILMSYSIINKEGRVLEARNPDNPAELLVGHGQILSALEKKILGETEGFRGDFSFTAAEAHGVYKKELVVEMKRDQFPEGVEISKGMKFESLGPRGEAVALHVLDFDEKKVLVDGNHPLAGEDLTYNISILEIRAAAKEEIAQGQVLTDMEAKNKTIH